MPMRWTRESASLTCSSRCQHTRQNSVGAGRGPVAVWRAGKSRICLSVDGKHLKVDCGFGLDHSKKMHFCSDAQMPRSVKTAPAVLTDRVRSAFRRPEPTDGPSFPFDKFKYMKLHLVCFRKQNIRKIVNILPVIFGC